MFKPLQYTKKAWYPYTALNNVKNVRHRWSCGSTSKNMCGQARRHEFNAWNHIKICLQCHISVINPSIPKVTAKVETRESPRLQDLEAPRPANQECVA